jgi:hypothetical protein
MFPTCFGHFNFDLNRFKEHAAIGASNKSKKLFRVCQAGGKASTSLSFKITLFSSVILKIP